MKNWIKKHVTKKRLIGVCSIAVVTSTIVGYNAANQTKAETRYVTGPVERGLLITSITGTGQVSGENQIDLKPKVSGDVKALLIKAGQSVTQNDVLMDLDRKEALKTIRDAGQSVRDANISLVSAKLSLAKLKQSPSGVSLLQAQNSVNQAKRDLDKLQEPPDPLDIQSAETQVTQAEQNAKLSSDGKTPQVVRDAYDASVLTLRGAIQSMQNSLLDADNVVAIDNTNANMNFANLFSVLDQGKKNLALTSYPLAKAAITATKTATDALATEGEDPVKIDAATALTKDALQKTTDMLTAVTDALRASLTSSNFSQSNLDSLTSKILSDRTDTNSKLSSVIALVQSVDKAKDSYLSSGINLQQAKTALEKLKKGPDPKDIAAAKEKIIVAEQQLADAKVGASDIDIAISQNSIDQRNSALQSAHDKLHDAQESLNDYSVRAPFDAVIAKVSVQLGDGASAGTAVATLVAKDKIATVTLNEVDVAKVKVNQKATLTFDAIDGLSISGAVEEIAVLGTVSQGVVSYEVKIGFDTQDERIRPGMSVRAAIITDSKADILMVPNAAVKSSGNQSYVELLDASASSTASTGIGMTGTPRRQAVETGLSNDSQTEITTGLKEGDDVIVQTIQPTTKTTAAQANPSVRIPGLTGGGAAGFGGGNATFRVQTGR